MRMKVMIVKNHAATPMNPDPIMIVIPVPSVNPFFTYLLNRNLYPLIV